jgi:PIN domain nuclease of toxin-antitoxin system
VLRRNLLDYGFEEITINSAHTLAIEALPNFHKDPFDRMLIAQTIVEGITLMTADSAVAEYPVAVVKV